MDLEYQKRLFGDHSLLERQINFMAARAGRDPWRKRVTALKQKISPSHFSLFLRYVDDPTLMCTCVCSQHGMTLIGNLGTAGLRRLSQTSILGVIALCNN